MKKVILLFIVMLFIVSPSYAGFKASARSLSNMSKSGSSMSGWMNMRAANSALSLPAQAANAASYRIPINIPKAAAAAAWRARSLTPAGIVLTAAMAAAGLLLNPEGDGYETPGVPQAVNLTVEGNCYGDFNGRTHNLAGGGTYDQCVGWLAPFNWAGMDWVPHNNQFPAISDPTLPPGTTEIPGVATPATDNEIADAVFPTLQNSDIARSLTDPATNAPYETIQPIADALNALETQLENLADNDPLNDPANPTPQQSVDDSILDELTRMNDRQEVEQDYTFNGGNPTYNTEIVTPEKTNLTEILDNIKQNQLDPLAQQIGVNAISGNCALSTTVSIGGQSKNGDINFCQYQPQFALIGTIVLGIAYLFSGLIVLGVKA